MLADANLQASVEREKLLYFVMLRQIETPSEANRQAYQRLADVASDAEGWDVGTLILDWLEAELRLIRQSGHGSGTEIMKAAIALSNALKQ